MTFKTFIWCAVAAATAFAAMGLFVEFNADRINAWIRKSELDLERSRRAYSFAYRRELVRLRRIDAEKAKTASERHRVRIAS